MGFREDAFTAQTDFNNTVSGTPITLVRKIELGYIQLALDYLMIKEVSTCSFFGGVGLRSSFLTYENFTSFYPFSGLSSSDFGGNIFCGVKFLSILRKPALQLNYYHGFLKIAENSVRDANNDVYNDELRSKSISLLLTLDLKK